MKIVILLMMAMAVIANASQHRICYHTNWSQYRPEPMKYFPENIDPFLCTHIMFSFATMEGNRLAPYEWNDDDEEWADGMYTRTINLKQQNPDLKVLLAVGGWNFGVDRMSAMLATPENRAEFVSTSITYLRDRSFDGLDLDFEYPGASRNDFSPPQVSPPEDKQRFTSLVQELRQAFNDEGVSTSREPLMLTAAVACGKDNIDNGYEVDLLAPNLDWIGLMSYDFNGAWDSITGHNSPLYGDRDPSAPEEYWNRSIDWCARYWEDLGAPRSKLVIGLATYGRGVTLTNSADSGLYASASGAVNAGEFTREAGFLASYEIIEVLEQAGGEVVWDPNYMTPYITLGDQWVSYDNVQSINEKMSYVLDNSYPGVMIWCLDLDDFGDMHYPLMNVMKCRQQPGATAESCADISTTTTTSTVAPSTGTASTTVGSTTAGTTTTGPGGEVNCSELSNGDYADPSDCAKFITCTNGEEVPQECSSGLFYNPVNGVCDWPYNLSPERQEECGLL